MEFSEVNNLYQTNYAYYSKWWIVLSSHHKEFDKNFKTEIKVDGKKLTLNHFVQETLANLLIGFLKTLKGVDEVEKTIELNITKMEKVTQVDAHTHL